MPHGTFDDGMRIVHREDGAKHIQRTDIGRGLAASVRICGEDEVCKGLPQHLAVQSVFLTGGSIAYSGCFLGENDTRKRTTVAWLVVSS